MGEAIHVISQVLFAVMKIQVPIIWQEFTLEKYRITERWGCAKVTLAGNVRISDHWGSQNHFQAIVWTLKTKKA